MKFSSILSIAAAVNGDQHSDASWGSWISWSSCSRTCGDGSRTRLRPCTGSSSNGCPGSSVETETCNDGACPTWSNWSSWNDCSVSCDGGTQSRGRICQNGDEDDCPGSVTDEQQCNQQSCQPGMVFWKETWGDSHGMRFVREEFLPLAETMLDRCVAYCISNIGCIGVRVEIFEYDYHDYYDYNDEYQEECYITDQEFYEIDPFVYDSSIDRPFDSPEWYITTIAVMQDFYELNSPIFERQPDGVIGGASADNGGLCDKTNTAFGMVDYRNLGPVSFSTHDDKNIIRIEDSTNCAAKCFETAGCSSFFVDENGCTYIIGRIYQKVEDANITDSGILNNFCPTNAFTSTFTKRSRLYCLIWAPDEAENIADSIVQSNIGNTETPLHVWSFETKSNNPLMKSSQYVSLKQPDMKGDDRRYRPIIFSIETHVRIGERQSRSADRESETAAQKQFMMPRTEDILTEIETIEQQATSFILDGGMKMPDNFRVAATGPIETLEFVQSAVDGSVSADCSSGSCECSAGFIDNGNGCEKMTHEQAATTQAPTTQAQGTTESPADKVAEFLGSLMDKLVSVFENNRPEKPRNHLMKKWQALKTKFTDRYAKMAVDKGCLFADSHDDSSIDWDSVNTCRVRLL